MYDLRGALVEPPEKQEPVWTDLAPDGYAEKKICKFKLTENAFQLVLNTAAL